MKGQAKVKKVSREEACVQIAELVEKYDRLSASERTNYNEENTINGFIRPLFEALGWNWEDESEVSAQQKAGRGRVDFAFRLGGVTRFYLEAKPLRQELHSNPEWVKQAVTYAFHNSIPYVVLTNFKNLWIFNGDVSPRQFLTLSAPQYTSDLESLWLLSREATEDGLLEKYGAKHGAFAPKISVEKRLYDALKEWRSKLFNDLRRHRKDLALSVVDEVIQRLFNRLIFIRTSEDRKLEDSILRPLERQYRDGTLKGPLLDNLRDVFADFDRAYDSELFMFHVLDQIHAGSLFDDQLADVIQGLYGPPGGLVEYDFSLIDADVLGRVYEQYLGHVYRVVQERHRELQLRLERGFSPEHALQETIELIERRQRRKARGIYYTPKWVVDYIVKQTVGRFIEEHEARPDAIHEMTILDPASGSGSFLIRAYDELLDYHRGSRPPEWVFSDERLRILKKNIYGVDLDAQAVEIARLNLLLRALRERQKLPELGNNIKRGNSLISGEPEELKKWFGDAWEEKHPLNWERAFPDVMANGGFDVVIGNPPYVNEARGNKELFRELKRIPILEHYYEKNMDLFNFFVEVGLDLLKVGGILGFIIPAYWQDRYGASKLRRKITCETNVERFIDFGDLKVFRDSLGHHSSIVILRKVASNKVSRSLKYAKVQNTGNLDNETIVRDTLSLLAEDKLTQCTYELSADKFLVHSPGVNVLAAITRAPHYFLKKGQVIRGVDAAPRDRMGEGVFVLSDRELSQIAKTLTPKEREFFKPFYYAHQVDRWCYEAQNNYWLLYTDRTQKQLLEKKPGDYKTIIAHLDKFRDVITSDNKPYGLHRPKKEENFLAPNKIIFVRKTPYPKFVLIPEPYFFDESMYLVLLDDGDNPHYLLGILNSKMAHFWYWRHKRQGMQLQLDKEIILSFPIREVDFSNDADKQMHDAIVGKVERMLGLQERLGPIRETPSSERDDIQREVDQTDKEIDQLVYELYGLTKAERRLVEGSLPPK